MSDREESVDRLDNGDGGSSPMDDAERNGGSDAESGSHGSENGHSPRPAGRSRSRSHSPGGRRHRRSRSRSRSRSKNGSRSKPRHSPREDAHRRHRSPGSRRNSRHDTNRENPPAGRCLGIFGLSIYTQERDLRDVFGKYGNIEDVQIVYDAQTSRSRGFAFVYFENKNDAAEAKEQCNGIDMDGRKIRVDFSLTQRAHTPTPGIYMGRPTNFKMRNSRGRGYHRGGGGGYHQKFRSDHRGDHHYHHRGRGFDYNRGSRRSTSPYRNSSGDYNRRGGGYSRDHHGPPTNRYRSRSRSFSPHSR